MPTGGVKCIGTPAVDRGDLREGRRHGPSVRKGPERNPRVVGRGSDSSRIDREREPDAPAICSPSPPLPPTQHCPLTEHFQVGEKAGGAVLAALARPGSTAPGGLGRIDQGALTAGRQSQGCPGSRFFPCRKVQRREAQRGRATLGPLPELRKSHILPTAPH
jgi:hypothetical protein